MHPSRHTKRASQWLVLLAATLLLAACGFQLRGAANLPFKSIFLDFKPNSPIAVELKRNIEPSGTVVVDDRNSAEAVLKVINDSRDKQVLTLNTNGRVREYALFQRFTFTVVDAKGAVIIPPTAINLRRVITYDENQELAKQSEEALLYRDMQSDLVQQILRRMSASRSALAAEQPAPEQ